ncbi:MAG: 50S ribosomal protein L20 [Rickettsiales bacterium]|nr:50S ribosomal protein L20 [Rickettsiales bacterium]
MARAQSSQTHRRHKKIIKMAKGYRGRSKSCFRTAIQSVEKGLQYAYRDRKVKKRTFRGLWIQRINAAARQHEMSYSTLMNGVKKAGIEIDRKIMAELAVHEPEAFAAIVVEAKKALAASEKATATTTAKAA